MGLFDKIKEPIFLKEDSEAQVQLKQLQALQAQAAGELKEQLDEEITRINAGIFGEQAIHFELANSHIPMMVLHDLYLEHNGLTAQIDYLIVTRANAYVLECKNLYGDIEIDSSGSFVRTTRYGRHVQKQGIYSPITQNRRHLELIKAMRRSEQRNFLAKAQFEESFCNLYHGIVVLANPKTVLNSRYAKKEVREQVIRADQLTEYIRHTDAKAGSRMRERGMKDLANYFLEKHKPHQSGIVAKYQELLEQQHLEKSGAESVPKTPKRVPEAKVSVEDAETLICPECGAKMVKRKATRGIYAGKTFYGCLNYPKCKCVIDLEAAGKKGE